MNTFPSGTVTFLFSDIEGSTKRWEHQPELMQPAFDRQERIMRAAMTAHGGYVYKMIGDAFQVAFATAPEALAAALDAQRGLSAEEWGEIGPIRVRMALHTGVTEERGDDYVGPLLNRVARLMSAGYGGQVLLTQAAYDLVRDHLPDGVAFVDLGEHRLKDLIRPEHVYQLSAPGLASGFPPLKTLDKYRHNLPAQLTSFIGREKEVEQIKERLRKNRLVTLTGSGGIGKTRLSIQTASELLDEYPNGVWLVELAPLTDPALVTHAVCKALDVTPQGNTPALNALTEYLRSKKILLVVDNCEHLIDACAQLCDSLLRACPDLRIITSSREALGIDGENAYRVPSLSLPDSRSGLQAIEESESTKLFMERANAVFPEFEMTESNAPVIAQICQRLDGIALAIELAASRVRILKVDQIAARLDDAFRLLTGGSRTALPRQQTLRALIDWSYNLLSNDEKTMLQQLSVFVGGWTLEAAEAVCCNANILELLTHLVDKSLVTVDREHGGETRYDLLETVRQYAREKLLESGEGGRVRTRHLDFFLRLAEESEPKLRGPEQHDWLDRLDNEHGNFRGALEWSLNEGCVERGLRLAYALIGFWDIHAYWREGMEATQKLLMQPEALLRTLSRANALLTVVTLSMQLLPRELQHQYLEESIDILREQGDVGKWALAMGLGLAGVDIFSEDLVKARSMVEESMAIARSLGDKWLVAFTLAHAGHLSMAKLDHVEARKLLEESLELFQSLGDGRWSAIVSSALAHEDIRQGDFAGARLRFQQALPILREERDKDTLRWALNALGVMAHAECNYDLAKGYYVEALELARDVGSGILSPAWNLACILLYDGDLAGAKVLFAECMGLAQKDGSKAVIAYAIQGYAALAAVQKQARKAVMLLAATRKLQEDAADKSIISPSGEADFARTLAIVREQVAETAFNAAWAEGRAMTMEQAIAYALEELQ